MMSFMIFIRANEESETKARRLKQAWENKRANIREKKLTARAPAWLQFNRHSTFTPIPKRAELVERIFLMTREGIGQHAIAQTFNEEKIPVWGRAKHWHRSYIRKILGNPAVIGTFVPQTLEYEANKKVRRPQEPVEGYFPAVVTPATWNEVQNLLAGRRSATSGRRAAAPVANILAGLATCPKCGGTATRVQKGRKSMPALVCAKAKVRAGCTYKSVRYEYVEQAILNGLPARLRNVPAGERGEQVEADLEKMESRLEGLYIEVENVVEAIAASPSPALSAKLRALEEELEKVKNSRQALLEARSFLAGPLVGSRVERLIETLEDEELDVRAVNTAIRSVFQRVVINYEDGLLEFHWLHGGDPCEVPFAIPTWADAASA